MSQCDGDGVIVIGWDEDAYENIEGDCPGCPRCRPCSECGGTGVEDDHGLKLSCYDCRGTGIEP